MLKTLLLFALVVYLGVAALAYLISDRLIFLPPSSSYTADDLPVRLVPTDDGVEVATLHLPNPAARFTLLYSHGNAEDLGHLLPVLQRLRDAGFAVLAYDYRGYGLSRGGPPSARGALRDQWAVYRHATGELGIPPERLVLFGRSVGSGPATALAARAPVAGLIVESGFVSAYRVVTGAALFPLDKFPNLRDVRRVRCPVLVVHGTRDRVIAPWHGRRLFAAAPRPKRALWVEGAGHNDVPWVGGAAYWQALTDFAALLQQGRDDARR